MLFEPWMVLGQGQRAKTPSSYARSGLYRPLMQPATFGQTQPGVNRSRTMQPQVPQAPMGVKTELFNMLPFSQKVQFVAQKQNPRNVAKGTLQPNRMGTAPPRESTASSYLGLRRIVSS